jgi:hypothetical protein
MPASPSIIAAMEALWRIPRPGPDNLLASPQFVTLSELCQAEYGGGKPVFALSVALRSLGLPCHLPAKSAGLALEPINAANAIDMAYRRTTTLRRHLCPLDLADELPPLSFGNARVEQFGADELACSTHHVSPETSRIKSSMRSVWRNSIGSSLKRKSKSIRDLRRGPRRSCI